MVDFGFPEANDVEVQTEYTILKSKPVNLHLARMPDNFKMHLPNSSVSKESTRVDRDLIIKKQKITEGDSKEILQYVMDDRDEVQKKGPQTIATKYIGREVTQNQKYLVFYRKDKDIRLCSLSSIISFKKDQLLKSSALDSIKGKRGGRQQGIKALLRNTGKKEEEKEKDKDKEKEKEKEDDDDEAKSWGNEDSDSEENENEPENAAPAAATETAAKGKNKKKDASMQIKNIFEEAPAVEAPKKVQEKDEDKDDKDGSDSDGKGSDDDSDSDGEFYSGN